jgi:hypothetical protein
MHIKQPKHDTGCLPPSIAEIKKGWSYTPTCGPGILPFIFHYKHVTQSYPQR